MMTFDPNDPAQKWVESDMGNQITNVGSNIGLYAGEGRSFKWDEYYNMLNDTRKDGKSLRRGWGQNDGVGVSIGNANPNALINIWIRLYQDSVDLSQPQYKIISKYDHRVIEGFPNGGGKMMTNDMTNLAQNWIKVQTANGETYVNVQTKLPLFVSFNEMWTYDAQKMTIVAMTKEAKAIDRTWAKQDGINLVWWQAHGAVNQQFFFEAV